MAYSREQLMTALRNADAAGDTEGARRIALRCCLLVINPLKTNRSQKNNLW